MFKKHKDNRLRRPASTKHYSEKMLRWIPINTRLQVALISLALIPLITLGFIAAGSASTEIERNIGSYTEKLMLQVLNKFTDRIEAIEKLAIEMRSSEFVLDYIKTRNSSDPVAKVAAEEGIRAYLKDKAANYGFIDTFAIYAGNTSYKSGFSPIIDLNKPDGLFSEISKTEGRPFWRFIDVSETGTQINGVALFSKIQHPIGGQIGVLQLLPSRDHMAKIAKELNLEEDGGSIFFLDSENRILISNRNDIQPGSVIQPEIMEGYLPPEDFSSVYSSYTRLKVSGEEMLASYTASPNGEWKVVSIVPFNKLMENTYNMIYSVVVIIVVSIILAVLIARLVTKSVYHPLFRLKNSVNALKEGDLTQTLTDPYNDEIAQLSHSFTEMVSSIRQIIQDARSASANVVKSSETILKFCNDSSSSFESIAAAVEDVATGSTGQLEEAVNTNDAMNELACSLAEVIDKARHAFEVTSSTKKVSEDANQVINELNEKAEITQATTNTIIKGILDLSKAMEKISGITQLISAVSEQTDLLALNAAIEAARAGEAGRGFAVVAEEVKKLSNESKQASDEISRTIADILKKVESIKNEAQHTEIAIQGQMQVVEQTDNTFRSITSSTEKIAAELQEMVDKINTMEKHKDTTVSSVSRILNIAENFVASTEEINSTTEHQIASAKQLENLAKEMNSLAVNLETSIQKFTV